MAKWHPLIAWLLILTLSGTSMFGAVLPRRCCCESDRSADNSPLQVSESPMRAVPGTAHGCCGGSSQDRIVPGTTEMNKRPSASSPNGEGPRDLLPLNDSPAHHRGCDCPNVCCGLSKAPTVSGSSPVGVRAPAGRAIAGIPAQGDGGSDHSRGLLRPPRAY